MGGLVAGLNGCGRPAPALLLAKLPPPDGHPVLTLPFEFYREFIFITVNVNGSGPRSFLLDSGTSDHELSLRAARELHFPLGSFHDDTGAAVGSRATESTSIKNISLAAGDAALYRGQITACDMAVVEKLLNHAIDGILGAPLFEAYVLQIDYANHVVRLFDPRRYELSGKEDIIPIRIRGHQAFLKGTITKTDGTLVQATLAIDTGADAPLSLNRPFDVRNELPGQAAITATDGTGLGGTTPDVYGRLKNLRIGKSTFPNIPTFFSLAAKGQDASDKYDGTVGNYLLVHFLVTFDYLHKKIILQNPTVDQQTHKSG